MNLRWRAGHGSAHWQPPSPCRDACHFGLMFPSRRCHGSLRSLPPATTCCMLNSGVPWASRACRGGGWWCDARHGGHQSFDGANPRCASSARSRRSRRGAPSRRSRTLPRMIGAAPATAYHLPSMIPVMVTTRPRTRNRHPKNPLAACPTCVQHPTVASRIAISIISTISAGGRSASCGRRRTTHRRSASSPRRISSSRSLDVRAGRRRTCGSHAAPHSGQAKARSVGSPARSYAHDGQYHGCEASQLGRSMSR